MFAVLGKNRVAEPKLRTNKCETQLEGGFILSNSHLIHQTLRLFPVWVGRVKAGRDLLQLDPLPQRAGKVTLY